MQRSLFWCPTYCRKNMFGSQQLQTSYLLIMFELFLNLHTWCQESHRFFNSHQNLDSCWKTTNSPFKIILNTCSYPCSQDEMHFSAATNIDCSLKIHVDVCRSTNLPFSACLFSCYYLASWAKCPTLDLSLKYSHQMTYEEARDNEAIKLLIERPKGFNNRMNLNYLY